MSLWKVSSEKEGSRLRRFDEAKLARLPVTGERIACRELNDDISIAGDRSAMSEFAVMAFHRTSGH